MKLVVIQYIDCDIQLSFFLNCSKITRKSFSVKHRIFHFYSNFFYSKKLRSVILLSKTHQSGGDWGRVSPGPPPPLIRRGSFKLPPLKHMYGVVHMHICGCLCPPPCQPTPCGPPGNHMHIFLVRWIPHPPGEGRPVSGLCPRRRRQPLSSSHCIPPPHPLLWPVHSCQWSTTPFTPPSRTMPPPPACLILALPPIPSRSGLLATVGHCGSKMDHWFCGLFCSLFFFSQVVWPALKWPQGQRALGEVLEVCRFFGQRAECWQKDCTEGPAWFWDQWFVCEKDI